MKLERDFSQMLEDQLFEAKNLIEQHIEEKGESDLAALTLGMIECPQRCQVWLERAVKPDVSPSADLLSTQNQVRQKKGLRQSRHFPNA